MYQQSIQVNKPHYKPVCFKSSSNIEDDDTIMPLEDFAAYELELQETILQLNSELVGGSDSSASEDESSCGSVCGSYADESEASASDLCEDVALSQMSHEQQQKCNTEHETSEAQVAFSDYELKLQRAIHELTSLSDGMVCLC